MVETVELEAQVSADMAGKRFDAAAAELFSDFSRSRLSIWIKSGELLLDGRQAKGKEKVFGGETLTIAAGTLDQPTGLRTVLAIYADEAADYHRLDDALETHGGEQLLD